MSLAIQVGAAIPGQADHRR